MTSSWHNFYESYHFSDLLLHLPTSILTEGNISLSTPEYQPLYDQAEVIITGNPTTVRSPVGNVIFFTSEIQLVYKVNVAQPWPCPFDFHQCSTGVTIGFWFWWNSIDMSKKRYVISLSRVFHFFKDKKGIHAFNIRANDDTGTWYGATILAPGKWSYVMWMINGTNYVRYVNGSKGKTGPKGPNTVAMQYDNRWKINPGLETGNFSLGPIQVWSGRKSPVFMWRLFQDGLPDYEENWDDDMGRFRESTGLLSN